VGEETARLRREIDQTRDDLTRDVDLIAEKTSPARIVERRVERTRRGLVGLKERVMGSNDTGYGDPYGAGYHGAGYENGEYRAWGQDESRTVAERAQGALAGAQEAAQGVGDRATAAVHRAGDAAQGTVASARQRTEGNPLAAGLIAFGVGWLVSSLLPASEPETRAARRVADTATEDGGFVDQAKQSAAELGDNLRDSARDAVEQVSMHAQDAAGTVKAEGAAAVGEVKDDAASAARASAAEPAATQR
jgi:hypothetical protein